MRALLLSLMLVVGAARAEVIAQATAGSFRLLLYSEPGQCVNGALKAAIINADERIDGCWALLEGDRVQVVFMDASIARVPIAAFSRPADL